MENEEEIYDPMPRTRRFGYLGSLLAIANAISALPTEEVYLYNIGPQHSGSKSKPSKQSKVYSSKAENVDVRTTPKIGRNNICPKCDSGKKYKKCCGYGLD